MRHIHTILLALCLTTAYPQNPQTVISETYGSYFMNCTSAFGSQNVCQAWPNANSRIQFSSTLGNARVASRTTTAQPGTCWFPNNVNPDKTEFGLPAGNTYLSLRGGFDPGLNTRTTRISAPLPAASIGHNLLRGNLDIAALRTGGNGVVDIRVIVDNGWGGGCGTSVTQEMVVFDYPNAHVANATLASVTWDHDLYLNTVMDPIPTGMDRIVVEITARRTNTTTNILVVYVDDILIATTVVEFMAEGGITTPTPKKLGAPDSQDEGAILSLYPNPCAGTFTVALSGDIQPTGQVDLIGPDGRVIKRSPMLGTAVLHMDMDDAEPGVYLVRYTDERSVHTARLVHH